MPIGCSRLGLEQPSDRLTFFAGVQVQKPENNDPSIIEPIGLTTSAA
jgi:hypothetical protein